MLLTRGSSENAGHACPMAAREGGTDAVSPSQLREAVQPSTKQET
jgi:hypothetical protein